MVATITTPITRTAPPTIMDTLQDMCQRRSIAAVVGACSAGAAAVGISAAERAEAAEAELMPPVASEAVVISKGVEIHQSSHPMFEPILYQDATSEGAPNAIR